jgi:hypothetical protein
VGLGGKFTLMNGPLPVEINKNKVPLYSVKFVPPPIKDFMNFKNMTSNEILLNLDNHINLADSELVGGMVELTKRKDKTVSVDWNEHPITRKCLDDLKQRQPRMSAKHVA